MAFLEHEFNLTVRDIDTKTYVTPKALLSFFEDIGGYHSNLVGFGLKDIEKTKLSWVLLHWKLKILKKVKYTDGPIRIKTWSRGLVRACTFRDFEAYDSKGNLFAIGSSKWTLIHLEKGLLRITDDIIKKYEIENKSVFDELDFKKLLPPETFSNTYDYTISRRDIDINNHMHNLNYLDLAYEALPEEIYNNNSFTDIEIMYKKQGLLGDNVICLYSYENGEHFVTIKNKDDNNIIYSIVKFS